MRDDLHSPNLGEAPEKYDKQFFWRAFRAIELFLSGILSIGSIRVNDLTADTATIGSITADGITADTIEVDGVDLTTALDGKVAVAGDTMTGFLTLHADPDAAMKAVTKQYADTKLALAGGTMTGFITLHADPDANLKAATKQYVDTMVPKAGGTMTGFLVLHADPDAAMKAATKQYVDGRTPNGSVINSAIATYTTNTNLTSIIPHDDTVPLSTEGTEILSVSITPTSATNKLRCRFHGEGACAATTYNLSVAMFQGSTCINAVYVSPSTANYGMCLGMEIDYTPGSTSSQTISVRVGPGAAGTIRMNGNPSTRLFGGIMACTLVVEEIRA